MPTRGESSTQDENFGGYRLARDLLIEDRTEAHVLETPAMDSSAAMGKTLGRIAHLAASRRNQLFDLGIQRPDPGHDDCFAFASEGGVFHAVDVPRNIDEPIKVSPINSIPIVATEDPAEGPRMGPSIARAANSNTFALSTGGGNLSVTSEGGAVRGCEPPTFGEDGGRRPFVIESVTHRPGSMALLVWAVSTGAGAAVELFRLTVEESPDSKAWTPTGAAVKVAEGTSPPLWCKVATSSSVDEVFVVAMETVEGRSVKAKSGEPVQEWLPQDDEEAEEWIGNPGSAMVPSDGRGMAAWKAFNAEGDSEDEDDDAPRNPFDADLEDGPLHVLMVSAWSDEVKTTARMPRNKPCAIVHGGAHIGVSHGVHCLTVSVEADGSARHVSTNQALSYVAKGKPNRKFVLATPDGTCAAVVETKRSSFVYRTPAPAPNPPKSGLHQIFDLTEKVGSKLRGLPAGGVARQNSAEAPVLGARLVCESDDGKGRARLVILTKGLIATQGVRAITKE